MAIFAEITENECINKSPPPLVIGDILTSTARKQENGAR